MKSMKILIADDDEDDRMVFVDALGELKMKTRIPVSRRSLMA